MPNVSTGDLVARIEAGDYNRLVVARSHDVWLLLVSAEGETLIHANRDGRHKEYRHAWQAKEWLAERFGITDVDVEYRPWQERS